MDKVIKVIKVIDENNIAINVGLNDDIKNEFEFLVYELGEELFEPDTNESLGHLEIVKGSAVPVHIQDKITIIKSNQYLYKESNRKIIKRSGGLAFAFAGTEEIIEPHKKELKPFDNPKVGDLVKIINKSKILK